MTRRTELINRFEKMLKGESGYFFDEDEFEDIALEYEMGEELNKSLNAIEVGLKFHPKSQQLISKKAYYQLVLKRVEDTKETLKGISKDTPESLIVKTELLLIEKDFDAAREMLDILLQSDDDPELYLRVSDILSEYKKLGEMLPSIIKVVKKIPDRERLAILMELVNILDSEGFSEAHVPLYEMMLDIEPFSFETWISLSKGYVEIENYEKSIEALEFAAAINPIDPITQSIKGYCLYKQRNFEEAIDVISRVLDTIEEKESAYLLIADCYSKLGRYDESDTFIADARVMFPDNIDLYLIEAENAYLSKYNYPKSIKLLKEVLQLEPNSKIASLLLAEICYETEDYSQTRRLLTRLIDIDKADDKVYTILGNTELKCQLPDIAIGYYKKALKATDNKVEILIKLVHAYQQADDNVNMQKTILQLELHIGSESSEEVDKIMSTISQLKDILRRNIDENI